tara:strand:- start:3766 stop:4929 length:1164 start_codon:yes stop_codon:yes gene_type:complete
MAIQAKYTPTAGLQQNLASGFQTGTLDLTADVTLTNTERGDDAKTFTLQVLADAANPGATVLAAFTGTPSAVVLTITPNNGDNNAATDVDLTTVQIAELINKGTVAGVDVTLTDASGLRTLQTASGGGAQPVVDAGEGDGKVATFSGSHLPEFHVSGAGISSDLETVTAQQVTIQAVASNSNVVGTTFVLFNGDGVPTTFFIQTGGAPALPSGHVALNAVAGRTAAQTGSDFATLIAAVAGFAATADGGGLITVINDKTGASSAPIQGTSTLDITVTKAGSGTNGGALNTTGVTVIDTGANCALTLGDLTLAQAGTFKVIKRLAAGQAGNNVDLTIGKHDGGAAEVKRFGAGQQLTLLWLGTQWADLISNGPTNGNAGVNMNSATEP